MKKLVLFISILTLLFSCNEQEKETSIIEKIAAANGIENFEEIKELRYTFNVKMNDSLRSSRSWIWHPQEKKASLASEDSTITYNYETEASENEQIDQRFINDQYWLLFPFHLIWDEMEWEHSEEAVAPISGEKMQMVTVTYPEGAGYTPGDVYEVYFGQDYMIKEWVYLSQGKRDRPLATTWENYEDFGGIKIAKTHVSEDGNFELFFTEIGIEK